MIAWMSRRGWMRAWALCTAAWGLQAAAADAPVPLDDFFQPPLIRSALLSPSGRWLASVVSPKGQRARLVITDVEDREPGRVVAQLDRLDVTDVQWVDDEWLIFSTSDVVNRDAGWYRRGSGLIAVRRSGDRFRVLIRRDWDSLFPESGGKPLEGNHRFLAMGAPGTHEIIVGGVQLDGRYEASHITPLVVNVETGERRSLPDKAPADAWDWLFDHQGRARVAVSYSGDDTVVHGRDLQTGSWKPISRFERLEATYTPLAVDGSQQLYVSHVDDKGHGRLSRLQVASGRLETPPLVSTPGFNGAVEPIQDRQTGDILGYDLLTDARSQVWLAEPMKGLQAKVDAALPGRVNLMQCGNCRDPEAVLVTSYADRLPPEYRVLRPKTGQWQRIGSARPTIDPQQMGRMSFHRIRARDGADLPVWITRPAGAADSARLPAVVLVHGGPWLRGTEWGWNAEAQFLASRGYLVIEPEFRGSTGYGSEHHRAGWKQWGRAMQDDVSDALQHAVKQGWADAARACIAGASYGGYATLMGLAKDPGLYRCGVAWVAVSDPQLMFDAHWSDISTDAKQHTLPKLIGDPVADAAMLRAQAPLHQADRIIAPLLLAHGGVDRRVPIEHGERMRDALRKAGHPPEWVVYEDEGHGFFRPENRIDFWRRVEVFLAKHLKP